MARHQDNYRNLLKFLQDKDLTKISQEISSKKLGRSSATLRKYLDDIDYGAIITHKDKTIIYANSPLTKELGSLEDDICCTKICNIFHEFDCLTETVLEKDYSSIATNLATDRDENDAITLMRFPILQEGMLLIWINERNS